MAKLQDKDPRFKNLEWKIGAVVALAIIGIIVVIILIGMEKDLFTKKYSLHFVSDSGSGFVEGMPVKLSGFKIGRIKDIELTEDARVKVTAQLNKKYERWVRSDSVARLNKEGLIGESIIEITVGSSTARLLADGEGISFEKAGGMEELVSQAKPILQEVKEIIHYVNSPQGDLKQAIGNLNGLLLELRQTRRSLDDVVKNANTMALDIHGKTGPVFASVEKVAKEVEKMTGRIDPIMTKVENIASNTEKITAKADKVLGNIVEISEPLSKEGPRIRNIIMDAETAAREGTVMLKGVKESWPVRLMVPPPKKPELVPLDGYFFERRTDEKK